QQHAVALAAHGGRDVVVLGGPEKWMQQEAVHRLESRLLDVFVRSVHGIARLEADHRAPTALGERAPGVRGIQRQLRERWLGAAEQTDVSPDQEIALSIELRDTGVLRVGSSVRKLRLLVLGVCEHLSDLEEGHSTAVRRRESPGAP